MRISRLKHRLTLSFALDIRSCTTDVAALFIKDFLNEELAKV